jgi:predicted membrane protein
MKKMGNVFWGILLVIAGVTLALNKLDILEINIFFDGWWTLFIIIPCAVGLFTEREKTGNVIGVIIGVCLLLCCRDILSFDMLWELLVPAIIVILGLKLVLSGLLGNKANEMLKQLRLEGKDLKAGTAVFSGCDMNYDGQVFEGAELNAIFGAVSCDLRNAVIQKDCAIQVSAIFGGIDILVPPGVNVRGNTVSIFGGMSNNTAAQPDAPTVYISGVCMFGGVEIK